MKSIQEIEAGLELDSDEEILRAQLATANSRIAELERVLEEIRDLAGTEDDEWDGVERVMPLMAELAGPAIAAAQKPEGGA